MKETEHVYAVAIVIILLIVIIGQATALVRAEHRYDKMVQSVVATPNRGGRDE